MVKYRFSLLDKRWRRKFNQALDNSWRVSMAGHRRRNARRFHYWTRIVKKLYSEK
jgi:hypothetical protein